eukprot:gene18014-21499_t
MSSQIADDTLIKGIIERIGVLEEALRLSTEENKKLEEKVLSLTERVDQQDQRIKELTATSTPTPTTTTTIKASTLASNAATSQTTASTPTTLNLITPTNSSASNTPAPLSPVSSTTTPPLVQSPNPLGGSTGVSPSTSTPASPNVSGWRKPFANFLGNRLRREASVDGLESAVSKLKDDVYAPPSSPKATSRRSSQNYDAETSEEGHDVSASTILRFTMPTIPESSEWAVVWEYNASEDEWTRGVIAIQMDSRPFASGALRAAHKIHMRMNPIVCSPAFTRATHAKLEEGKKMNLRKLPRLFGAVDAPYVAKVSKTEVAADRYFDDVKMQMLCKEYSTRYNDNNPPKSIDFLSAWVIEIQPSATRSTPLLCALEMFMTGEFKKLNSNFGNIFGERNTPQAFSHFTYEASAHDLIVVDIQGVDDHYTDPQIHTKDGKGFGAGNLGEKGIERFIKSHKCNPICIQYDLPPIGVDLADSRNMTRVIRGTMLLPDLVPDLDKPSFNNLPVPANVAQSELVNGGTLSGHVERVCSLLVTSDNKTMYSGSADGTIKIWNLETMQCTETIRTHRKAISSIIHTATNFISASMDGTIRVWDRVTNEPLAKMDEHTAEVNSICIDHTRNYLFSCSHDKSIRVWDMNNGYKCIKVLTAHSKSVKSIVISGKYLFSASNDQSIKVWDLDMLVCIYGIADAHDGWITSLALHSGLGCLLSGCRDGTFKMWSLSTFMPISSQDVNNESVSDILVNDRFIFVASEDNTIKIWDTSADINGSDPLKCIYTIKAHRSSIHALATDGQRLFSGSCDNSIKFWTWKDK